MYVCVSVYVHAVTIMCYYTCLCFILHLLLIIYKHDSHIITSAQLNEWAWDVYSWDEMHLENTTKWAVRCKNWTVLYSGTSGVHSERSGSTAVRCTNWTVL